MSDNNDKEPSATAISRRIAPGGGGGGAWLGGPKTASSEKFGNDGKKNFHLLGTDLFGDEVKQDAKGALRERFDFPPFTILNAREGVWQDRKRAWLACGIQSEVGRGDNLLKMSDTLLEPDPEKRAVMQAARGNALTFGSGGPGDLAAGFNRVESATLNREHGFGTTTDPYRAEGEIVEGSGGTGTSIFDPVLTELCYRWFCPAGGQVVDPFAGGSVRGLVAGLLGFNYFGIDLRPEQIAANETQRAVIAPEANIVWAVGDSNDVLPQAPEADFIFSCPPYGDLEHYSDDPSDLSNMTWNQFVKMYMSIIKKAVARLKNNRFACFVVGEYRDKETGLYRGFVPLTCAAFMSSGASLYNEAILVTAVGSLPIRVTKQFETSRKLGKTHQNVLIFCKGDPKLAAEAIARGDASGGSTMSLAGPILPLAAWPTPAIPPVNAGPGPFSGQALPLAEGPGGELMADLEPMTPSLPPIEVRSGGNGSLADFLGTAPMRARPDWQPQEPPSLDGINEIVLNFETNGLDWLGEDEPIGVTVGTFDGKLKRFLPFAFNGGGNLDRAAVIRFLQNIRGKYILNANTRFDIHMGRKLGVDFEAQGNTVGDIMHYAALLDDHRRKFAVDVLAKDWLGGIEVQRMDERNMAQYAAYEVATRAEYQVKLVADLRAAMWPELEKQDLQQVRQLEDETIYPVVEMEKNGSPIDEALVEQCYNQCNERQGQLMLEISQECGFAFDHTTSGWQRLFEYCNLTPSDSYAEKIVGVIDHPLIRKAYFAGQLSSLNSKTFAAYKKLVRNGVLYYDINQLRGDEGGTVSGRFSIGYIQQVPNHDNHHAVFGEGAVEDCLGGCYLFPRRVFIPGFGDYLEADAAQIEYRLFAHFAGNEEVLEAYRQNPKMSFHKKTWAMFKVLKPDQLYSHQKNFNFAKQYGAKTIKLAVMGGYISEKEGEEIRQAKRWDDLRLKEAREMEEIYKRVMPEGDALLDRASHLAKPSCDGYCKQGDTLHREYPHRGWVKTISGRRSRFLDNYKTYIALNRVLQGSGADIMKRKMCELHKERKYTGFLMRMTVHDQFGGDAQMSETRERVAHILDQQAFPHLKVPILWDVKLGRNWAEAK